MIPPEDLPPAQLQLWMERLLRHARHVGESGEIPVAAVLLDARGRALGWGSNRRHRDQDPLGHAELVALSQAARLRRDWRFNDCTLLVTLEPCPMCAGAILQARVPRLVYGASDPKAGAVDSLFNLLRDPRLNHRCEITAGVLAGPCGQILTEFFESKRRLGKK